MFEQSDVPFMVVRFGRALRSESLSSEDTVARSAINPFRSPVSTEESKIESHLPVFVNHSSLI